MKRWITAAAVLSFLFFLFCAVGVYQSLSGVSPVDVSGAEEPDERIDSGILPFGLIEGDYLRIPGYVYREGEEIETVDTSVLIRDEGGSFYRMPTRQWLPDEVVFEPPAENCCFISIAPAAKLPPYGEIYILCNNNDDIILINTGEYYSYEALKEIYDSYH